MKLVVEAVAPNFTYRSDVLSLNIVAPFLEAFEASKVTDVAESFTFERVAVAEPACVISHAVVFAVLPG